MTLPLREINTSHKEEIINFSRKRYTKPRSEVENNICIGRLAFLNLMASNYLSKSKSFLLPNEQIVFQSNPHCSFFSLL